MKTNTQQQDSQTQSFDNYDFSLKALFVFNPTLKPQNPKPSEQDIQDAKLLFYHPQNVVVDEQRNQVGMAEGVFMFCDSFDALSNENNQYPRYQTIHLVEQTHTICQLSNELYIFFTFSHLPIQVIKSSEEYYQPECHQFYFPLSSDVYQSVCQNFIQTFQIFCGSFDKLPKLLPAFIPTWTHCHCKPSTTSLQQLNFLAFQNQQFRYAPLDGQLFLTLQYLSSLLHQVDSNLEEIAIFYNGYFIFSSLSHKISIYFKELYYESGLPWLINEQKITQKFKHHEVNEQDTAFMHFCNLKNLQKWGDNICPQKVYLPNNKNEFQEYNYFTYLEKNFLVLLFCKPTNNFTKLKDVQLYIQRNCEKITSKLDSFIDQGNAKQETLRFIYYNGMNLAYKVSNAVQISKISADNVKVLYELNEKMRRNQHFRQEVIRIGGIWFCAVKVLGRCVLVILPGTIAMNKLEEELNRALETTFSTLFL